MREKLYRTLLSQDIAFFDTEAVGDLTSRLGSDCQQVARIIGGDVNIMLRNALQGVGALVYLLLLSWQLALSTAFVSGVLWCGIRVYANFQQRAARVVQDTLAEANEVRASNPESNTKSDTHSGLVAESESDSCSDVDSEMVSDMDTDVHTDSD